MRLLLPFLLMLCCLPARAADLWLMQVDRWGTYSAMTLMLQADNGRLSGSLDGDVVEGRRDGNTYAFSATDRQGQRYRYRGTIDAQGHMRGTADFPDPNNPLTRVQHTFTARPLPARAAAQAQTHDFAPTDFSNSFSPIRLPVLTIWPGDTVRTHTLDSGGVDAQGITRALYGNPQTGPFFIMGAERGDTLVVHLRRLRLNRDWADSLDALVGRAQTPALAARAAGLGQPVRWTLDLEHGLARLTHPSPKLAGLAVPVRPMLGGLAVAPPDGPGVSTGDTGAFGGNMDFNAVVEGNTVLLPVQQPGALLYLGDGHAAQGDGETSQFALETSLDVTFTVELIKGKAIGMPRVESATELMTLGQAGSLDDALRQATAGMVLWLQQDYGMSVQEAAIVLGSCVHYTVANLAGRSVGIAASVEKDRLPGAVARMLPCFARDSLPGAQH